MFNFYLKLCVLMIFFGSVGAVAQNAPRPQEISDGDGLPVLVKHLPDWPQKHPGSVFAADPAPLKTELGERPVIDLIDFRGGTEAVTASYPEGRLLIVEYSNPQLSSEADSKFLAYFAAAPESSTVYRRIGNYNVFVFDAPDQAAANSLLDQIKYQKTVQWLGEDPYLSEKLERYFVVTTRDIFISTVLWIIGGIFTSVLAGVLIGFVFYRIREQRRRDWKAFSDAGGLTRLNLDELSE